MPPNDFKEYAKAFDEIGYERAENRSKADRTISWFGTKVHKWKKPKNLANVALEVSHGILVTIPILGSALINLEMKAVEHFRSKHRARKLKKAQSVEKTLKFTIKELDVSELDRARFKVVRQREQYNKAATSFANSSGNECINAFWLAYRYRRYEYRLDKLASLGETLEQLGSDIVEWTASQEKVLYGFQAKHLSNIETALEKHKPDACGNACILHGTSTGASNFKSYVDRHIDAQGSATGSANA